MTLSDRGGMNDANFAAVITSLQESAREDRQALNRHIDDCIEERREAKRDRHEMANRIGAVGAELHGRISRMERRWTTMLLSIGGTGILLLFGIIGWMITVSVKGFWISPLTGGQ